MSIPYPQGLKWRCFTSRSVSKQCCSLSSCWTDTGLNGVWLLVLPHPLSVPCHPAPCPWKLSLGDSLNGFPALASGWGLPTGRLAGAQRAVGLAYLFPWLPPYTEGRSPLLCRVHYLLPPRGLFRGKCPVDWCPVPCAYSILWLYFCNSFINSLQLTQFEWDIYFLLRPWLTCCFIYTLSPYFMLSCLFPFSVTKCVKVEKTDFSFLCVLCVERQWWAGLLHPRVL